jgi:hypothetical protein
MFSRCWSQIMCRSLFCVRQLRRRCGRKQTGDYRLDVDPRKKPRHPLGVTSVSPERLILSRVGNTASTSSDDGFSMTSLLTIDFEASCLPKHGLSFPIEVGIADQNGWSRAWLIEPHKDWADWSWTMEAEHLHGITREHLHRQGLPAARVLVELIGVIGQRRVIADSYLDEIWFRTLCAAARMPLPCRIEQICKLTEEFQSTPEEIGRAIDTANLRMTDRHRAAFDAVWLAIVVNSLEVSAVHRSSHAHRLFPWVIAPASLPSMIQTIV